MSKKFVRVPMTVTLQGTVLVELQENESLETIDPMELEVRALENFDCNNDEFYAVAKEKSVGADGSNAYIIDDDEEDDEEDDFDDECLEDDEYEDDEDEDIEW